MIGSLSAVKTQAGCSFSLVTLKPCKLLEVSFVGLLYAPSGWRPRPSTGEAEPPAAGVWLMRLVLFKLMLIGRIGDDGSVRCFCQTIDDPFA